MPLALGGARSWAYALAEAALGLCGLVYVARLALGQARWAPMEGLRVSAVLGGAVFLWGILQLLPIAPPSVAHPGWQIASQILGRPLGQFISVDPVAGLDALGRLSLYALTFVLAYQQFRDPAQADWALALLATAASVYALYGLISYALAPDTLLWMRRWAYFGDVTGPFVNRNSFATFVGLGLLANYAWLRRIGGQLSSSRGPLRLRFAAFLVAGTRSAPLPLIGVASTAAALILTHSRGGLIAASAGLIAMLAIGLFARWRRSLLQNLLTAAAFIVILATLATSGGATLDRLLGTDPLAEERLQVYQMARNGIAASPLLGHGIGSFEAAFPAYATTPAAALYRRAHNDYLESAFELGIPAAAMLVLSLALIALRCLVGAISRRRNPTPALLAFGASVLVGVHALTDFSLQIPAVALTFATILGIGAAHARSPRNVESQQ